MGALDILLNDGNTTMVGVLVFLAAATLTFSVMAVVRVQGSVKRRAANIGRVEHIGGSGGGSRSLRYSSMKAAQRVIEYTTKAYSSGSTEETKVLRRRMIQLLSVVVFPLLATLVLLAPVVIPWLFGEAWEPSVLPTQILVVGGAATMAINAAGSALMAEGRARALLGYGIAHFVVYAGAVLVVAHLGLAAVAIAGSVVHGIGAVQPSESTAAWRIGAGSPGATVFTVSAS